MKTAHTSSTVQDRKPCDASRTPAGGTDSTAACTEPCSRKNTEALTDRRTSSHNKNNKMQEQNTATLHIRVEVKCHAYKHSGTELQTDTNANTVCACTCIHTFLWQNLIQATPYTCKQPHVHGSSLGSTGVSNEKCCTAHCTA